MKKNQIIALIIFAMKLTVVQLTIALIFTGAVYADGLNAQALLNKTVNISVEQTELKKVISLLQTQTGAKFIYSSKAIHAERKINCNLSSVKFSRFIETVLKPLNIAYKIVDDKILLYPVDEAVIPQTTQLLLVQAQAEEADIKGIVKNERGEVLAGASVQLKNTNYHTLTDGAGNFAMNNVPVNNYTLTVSYVGYTSKEMPVIVGANMQSLEVKLSEDALQLQQVIVTGTGTPKKKIESSVAITTVSSATLEARSPLNSADVIKAIPGVMVNSSGGDGPGNVFVRGLPSPGGYLFFGIMEDGLPVLPTGFNSFPSPDQNFKTDLTIKTIEAIRGGNAPLVMTNTAGALMNNISYTGAAKTYGKFKFITGLSQEMYRVDGNVGGSLSSKVKYNIGGFYRTDKGIRPPTYTANKGGQLKANLTWNFNDKGYVRIFTKYINDKSQWQLPAVYAYNKEKRAEPFQGFDMYTETLVPSQTKFDVKMPEGDIHHTDFEKGYLTKLAYGGFLFNYNINGWNIKNNFRYQRTSVLGNYPILAAISPFSPAKKYYYTDGSEITNPTGYYAVQQLNDAKREDAQVINYLDLTKKAGKHSITLGGGIHVYNVISNEAKNSIINTGIGNQPAVILAGASTAPPASAAANTNPGGHTKFDGVTSMSSVYLMDEITLNDKWRVEAGMRVDNFNLHGNKAAYGGSSVASGGTGFVITGMTPWSDNETYWSASIAANYKVSNSLAFFIRGTRSYNAFNITDFTALDFNPANLKKRKILMGELGAKYANGPLSVFSSLSYTVGKNLPQGLAIPNDAGALAAQSTFASSRSIGWETELAYQLFKGLNIRITATFQDPVFTDHEFKVDSNARQDIAGKTLNWKGNRPQNTPTSFVQFGGTYDYKMLNVFANVMYQSSFWSTSANTYKIPSFTEVVAGVGVKMLNKKVEVRGWGNNLLNIRALTAGNVRGEQFLNEKDLVEGQAMIGRAATPRTLWLSVAYSF